MPRTPLSDVPIIRGFIPDMKNDRTTRYTPTSSVYARDSIPGLYNRRSYAVAVWERDFRCFDEPSQCMRRWHRWIGRTKR